LHAGTQDLAEPFAQLIVIDLIAFIDACTSDDP